MKITFDAAKAKENQRKHGISLADAAQALHDPMGMTREDDAHEEERFVTVGLDMNSRLVTVVYTYRGDVTRVISARLATSGERRSYEEGI